MSSISQAFSPGISICSQEICPTPIIHGTTGPDDLTSDANPADGIYGYEGNDRIFAYGGDTDTLLDRVYPGLRDDLVIFNGGGGDDHLTGGYGDDTIIGGADVHNIQSGAGEDSLVGLNGRDVLDGGADVDDLSGGADNDQLRGGTGSDTLEGGSRRDILIGGTVTGTTFPGDGETDYFVFSDPSGSPVGVGRDIIRDFEAGIDQIVLNDMLRGMTFIGMAAFADDKITGGSVRYVHVDSFTIVQADLDDDDVADMEIRLDGTLTLTQADFILASRSLISWSFDSDGHGRGHKARVCQVQITSQKHQAVKGHRRPRPVRDHYQLPWQPIAQTRGGGPGGVQVVHPGGVCFGVQNPVGRIEAEDRASDRAELGLGETHLIDHHRFQMQQVIG